MDISNNDILKLIDGLYQNQQVLNSKLDYVLTLLNDSKIQLDNNGNNLNHNAYILQNFSTELKNKFSDLEINLQNSNSDIYELKDQLNNISNQIEEVNRKLQQWEIYSKI